MLQGPSRFVPILTSEAGSCLTALNWQEVTIDTVSYYLDALLIKPGQAVLEKISDLKSYLGWPGALVINAQNLIANKQGMITLTSPYDGSKIQCSYSQLVAIIHHLKPDAVLLPKKILELYPAIWTNWPESIIPYIHVEDLQQQDVQRRHGIYFKLDAQQFNDQLLDDLDKWSHLPRYIIINSTGEFRNIGMVTLDLIKRLRDKGIEHIESDVPAADAVRGLVYGHDEVVDIANSNTKMQFEIIKADCTCPTCSQQLTKAYLHHLLLHTPLLCHRFLIQHNVYLTQSQCRNEGFNCESVPIHLPSD